MPHLKIACRQHLLNGSCKIQEPETVRHRRPIHPNDTRHLLVSHIKFVDQSAHPQSRLQGIEILTLQIFDQRHGDRRFVINFPNNNRYIGQSSALRCPPSPFTGDQFILIGSDRTNNKWLQQPLTSNRGCQIVQRAVFKVLAGLILPGSDKFDGELPESSRVPSGCYRLAIGISRIDILFSVVFTQRGAT